MPASFAIQALRWLVLGMMCLGSLPVTVVAKTEDNKADKAAAEAKANEENELKDIEALAAFFQKLQQSKTSSGEKDYCSAVLFLSVVTRPPIDSQAVEFGKRNTGLLPELFDKKSSANIKKDADELKRSWLVVNEVLKRVNAKDDKSLGDLNDYGWRGGDKISTKDALVLEPGDPKDLVSKLGKNDSTNKLQDAVELLDRALNYASTQEKTLAKSLPDEIRSRATELLMAKLNEDAGKNGKMTIRNLDDRLTKVDRVISESTKDPTPRSLLAAAVDKWAKDAKTRLGQLVETVEGLDPDLKQQAGMRETVQGILQRIGEKYGINAEQSVQVHELEEQARDLNNKIKGATEESARLKADIDKLNSNVATLTREKADLAKERDDLLKGLKERDDELARRPSAVGDTAKTEDVRTGTATNTGSADAPQPGKDHILNLIIGGIGFSMALLVGLGMYYTKVRPANARARKAGEQVKELLKNLEQAEAQVAEQKQKLDRTRMDPSAREKQLAKEKQKVENEFDHYRRTAETQLQNHPAARALESEKRKADGLVTQITSLQGQIKTLATESDGHRRSLEQLQAQTEQQQHKIRLHEGTVADYKKQVEGLNGQLGQRDASIDELERNMAGLKQRLQAADAAAREKEESIRRMEKSLLPAFLDSFPGLLDLLRSDSSEWKALRGRFQVLNALLQSGDKVTFMDELKMLGRGMQQSFRKLGVSEADSKQLVAAITGWARQTFPDLKVEVPDIGEKFDDNRMINLSRQCGSEVSAVASWIIWEGAVRKFAGEVETIV